MKDWMGGRRNGRERYSGLDNDEEDRLQTRGALARAIKHIRDQEEWIRDHGATLDGYIQRYTPTGLGTEDGATIYQADVHYLQLLVASRNGLIKAMRAA